MAEPWEYLLKGLQEEDTAALQFNPWYGAGQSLASYQPEGVTTPWISALMKALAGFGSGALKGLGASQASEERRPAYEKALQDAGISSEVLGEDFNPYEKGYKTQLISALTKDQERRDLQKVTAPALIKALEPAIASAAMGGRKVDIVPNAQGSFDINVEKAPEQPIKEHIDPKAARLSDWLGETLEEKQRRLLNERVAEYRKMGLNPPATLAESIDRDLATQRAAAKDMVIKQMPQLEEKITKARDMREKLGNALNVLQSKDLLGPSLPTAVRRFANQKLTGDDETQNALAAMQSITADVISGAKAIGSGSTSDYEDRTYLASGISTDKPYEINQRLLEKLAIVEKMGEAKKSFILDAVSRGQDVIRASAAWEDLVKAVPRYTYDKSGKPSGISPIWASGKWQDAANKYLDAMELQSRAETGQIGFDPGTISPSASLPFIGAKPPLKVYPSGRGTYIKVE